MKGEGQRGLKKPEKKPLVERERSRSAFGLEGGEGETEERLENLTGH